MLGRLMPQIILQSSLMLVTALLSFIFMTWLVNDVFMVDDTYVAAGYEMLGCLIIMVLVLVPLNTVVYRRRARELSALSKAIAQVAGGDYSTKIPIEKGSALKPVYEDFNKMCAELDSVQLLRNDFINSYSHEFRTPIASINGFASLLLEKELKPQEQRKYLEIIVDESARLSKLASNTILLSRLSSQQIVTDTEEYDLSEQLRQCSIILSPKWMEKKLEFSGEFPSLNYRGNKEMMQHLWLNLIDNAIKYTPQAGEISLSLEKKGDMAVVTVSDSGPGIDEEDRKHLFEPYYQAEGTHASQGLGLGLAIARRIVELCRGQIRVESEPGLGSRFIVSLPLDG